MMNSTEVIRRTAAISKNWLPGSKSSKVNARGPEVDPAILAPDLEPISFDDLPLGGEWTTRRRTISESEIALFAAVAGDFSPLTIDAGHAGTRFAPPALLVAMAVGLGTMDMPVPSIAEWEWLNWKFPRPVRAGETIYARWTLTQKRPPVGGAPTAIVVWRVDVHTADGALCAEGEVGASVRRKAQPARPRGPEPARSGSTLPAPAPAARRRRGRRPAGSAPQAAPPPMADEPIPPPIEVATNPATAERTGAARRRRRRRPRTTTPPANDGQPASSNASATPVAPPPEPGPIPVSVPPAGAISRVMKRLRRT
jgi:acyl dehydratase